MLPGYQLCWVLFSSTVLFIATDTASAAAVKRRTGWYDGNDAVMAELNTARDTTDHDTVEIGILRLGDADQQQTDRSVYSWNYDWNPVSLRCIL